MQFDWYKYLVLADTLCKYEDEAAHRTAISRAYYALYNVLLQYITGVTRHKNNHRELINIFQDVNQWSKFRGAFLGIDERDIVYIGIQLENIRNLRNDCDYSSLSKISQKKAKQVCETVNLIFDIISEAQEKS
jgi:uncharacterized protein (UPF0332 family)